MHELYQKHKLTFLVVAVSLLIGLLLIILLWDMNFWPSDERVYYYEAALDLPNYQYISQMDDKLDQDRVYFLHGKELFVLGISWMQRVMQDTVTIRPFVVLGVLLTTLSFILIYFIIGRLLNQISGFVCFGFFAGCIWPYLYILFAKHQTQGLFFSLLAILFLQRAQEGRYKFLLHLGAGISLGVAYFSSTNAVLYWVYYAALFLYYWKIKFYSKYGAKKSAGILLGNGLLTLIGIAVIFAAVNLPDVIGNIKKYVQYISVSQNYNHFIYNQPFLQQWFFKQPITAVRGGWLWVIKYFMMVMPVIFPLSLAMFFILVFVKIKNRAFGKIWELFFVFCVCFSSALVAEKVKVAQYGANYFPALLGLCFFISFAFYRLTDSRSKRSFILTGLKWKKVFGVALLFHLVINFYFFATDVYPSRMATTFLSRSIRKLGVDHLYTYRFHPHRDYFTEYLNPDVVKKLLFVPINNIMDPKEGYILVPPPTGDSIYLASTSAYTDFSRDIFLNELLYKGTVEDYAVASFPSLANSRFWFQEEEILSYRSLILGHDFARNKVTGRVWLLDAKKLQEDRYKNVPHQDYIFLHKNDIRNIGTIERRYAYRGYRGLRLEPQLISKLIVRMYKVGNPQDMLIAYVYRTDETQRHLFVPVEETHFSSHEISGEALSSDSNKALAVFDFDPPLKLAPGYFAFNIFRTGQPDDKNYYRIYEKNFVIQ